VYYERRVVHYALFPKKNSGNSFLFGMGRELPIRVVGRHVERVAKRSRDIAGIIAYVIGRDSASKNKNGESFNTFSAFCARNGILNNKIN
jgi:hypothetical protein